MAAETLAVFVRAVLVDQFFELTSRQGFHYFGKSGISIHVAGLVLFESSTRSLSPKPWPATLSATPPNLFRTAVRLRGNDGTRRVYGVVEKPPAKRLGLTLRSAYSYLVVFEFPPGIQRCVPRKLWSCHRSH